MDRYREKCYSIDKVTDEVFCMQCTNSKARSVMALMTYDEKTFLAFLDNADLSLKPVKLPTYFC